MILRIEQTKVNYNLEWQASCRGEHFATASALWVRGNCLVMFAFRQIVCQRLHDRNFIYLMRKLLNDSGIDTWMVPGDIPIGSNYGSVINLAVKEYG